MLRSTANTIIFGLLRIIQKHHGCCPLWSPTPALCLPNKGNHRDTRLVHKGDLQYIHTLFVKQHIFLGLRLSFFAGVGNFSYILQGWEWCVAQLSGWHSLCLMHYTAQFWQGRISFFISYLLLFYLISFYLFMFCIVWCITRPILAAKSHLFYLLFFIHYPFYLFLCSVWCITLPILARSNLFRSFYIFPFLLDLADLRDSYLCCAP